MTYPSASLTYRRATMQQASTVGLVIALLDTLAGDLNRAIAAMDCNDIQTRSNQLTHAFAILQHLEMMIDSKNGGATAAQLKRFYRHLHKGMLDAQFVKSTAILQGLIQAVFEVREAWQQVDAGEATPGATKRGKTEAKSASAKRSQHDPAEPESRLSFSC